MHGYYDHTFNLECRLSLYCPGPSRQVLPRQESLACAQAHQVFGKTADRNIGTSR